MGDSRVNPTVCPRAHVPTHRLHTIHYALGVSLGTVARLDTLVTVVDAGAWAREHSSGETLAERKMEAGPGDERTVVDLLIDQVEVGCGRGRGLPYS